ncbi:unnamed protein product [Heligmosomoides polygyrus]|uniref:Uncharacterized protein n=1 Tax=Heligmosomoides polygyrus TaxID=6339 RepID=A0A3P7YZM8_HELPZ|nr:unnamed protein product [Heligmosomoides polygyrus]
MFIGWPLPSHKLLCGKILAAQENFACVLCQYSQRQNLTLALGDKFTQSHPLSQTTLLILSVARFVEILTQLDYRGTGDDMTFAWKIHHTADFVALICYFCTAMIVIRMMGNDSVEADELHLRFNNPLTIEESGDYLQLRHQEDS